MSSTDAPSSAPHPNPYDDGEFRTDIARRMKYIHGYTHAIRSTTRGVGTGVTFRVGGRLFLMTAGHNLIDRSQFLVALFTSPNEPARIARILNYHFHPASDDPTSGRDIGFIEVVDVPSVRACPLEQFKIGAAEPVIPPHDSYFSISGYPAGAATDTEMGLAVIPGRLVTGDEFTLQLEYERSGYSIAPDGSSYQRTDFFESPHGFSGGGVWATGPAGQALRHRPI